MRAAVAILLAALVWCSCASLAGAQQAAAWIHNQGLNDSFFEGFNVGFGFNIPGGGGVVGLLPNGQFTPNGQLQFRQNNDVGFPLGIGAGSTPATAGFALNGSNGSAFFNLSAAQGSDRSMSSTAAGVTMMNGGTGSIFSGSQRPFVTGIVPVVGEFNNLPAFPGPGALGGGFAPVVERVARLQAGERGAAVPQANAEAAPAGGGGRASSGPSSATRGDLSVAEIRAQKAAEKESHSTEVAELEQRALAAEEAGKPGVARIYYRMAVERAEGAERERLLVKLASFSSPGSER